MTSATRIVPVLQIGAIGASDDVEAVLAAAAAAAATFGPNITTRARSAHRLRLLFVTNTRKDTGLADTDL